ncbi:helix-turn-helix domain-containing protein [Streptomyces sp. NBC_00356]|uniref:AraC-like ligand-binding domain-containing protein n=1 Tax=Streptomyces sp. NBC_00356 TaxID=2975724 RepID=UPI002E259D01
MTSERVPSQGDAIRRNKSADLRQWTEVMEREHAGMSFRAMGGDFAGELRAVGERDLHMLSIDAKSLASHRSSKDVARDATERIDIVFMLDGGAVAEQNGEQTVLRSGEACLVNLGAPFRFHCPGGFRQLVLSVPTAEMRRRGTRVDELMTHALRVDSHGLGAPWLAFVQGLWSLVSRQGPGPLSSLLPSLLEATEMLMGTSPDLARAQSASKRLYAEAMSLIETSSHDPGFGPDTLAAMLHVSRRTVFRAFAEHGATVAAEILRCRLGRAERALRFQGARVTVEHIAHACGFRSTSTFHARFQEQFGVSPRRYARGGAPRRTRVART